MGKKLLVLLGLVLAIGLVAAPTLLQALPDRYVVRWVPQPLQSFLLPETGSPILPTLVPVADAAELLQPTSAPTFTPAAEPPTPTAVVIADEPTAAPLPTATATVLPPTATPIPFPAAVRLSHITHQFQEWNNCGPATLAMSLSYFDLPTNQSTMASVLKPNPEDRNVSPSEMMDYVNN
jgi:hypothetical protein